MNKDRDHREDMQCESAADQTLPNMAYSKFSPYGKRLTGVRNTVWGLLGGWVTFLYFVASGILFALTLIGLKKAYKCFQIALFTLMPFGKNAATDYASHKLGNTLWAVTFGWQISFYCLLSAGLWYLTYFGRFLGARWFHLAQFVIAPFGAKITDTDLLTGGERALVGRREHDKEFEL